jgi:hypothetical protein
MSIEIFKDFLSETEKQILASAMQTSPWSLTAYTVGENDRRFWYKDLEHITLITDMFKKHIEKRIKKKIEVKQLYVNGQAHGQCGSMHTDVNLDAVGEHQTMIYYHNQDWRPEYGGHTMIIDNDDTIHSIYPLGNSCVIFDSKLQHVGLEPTCHLKTQRETVACKFMIKPQRLTLIKKEAIINA